MDEMSLVGFRLLGAQLWWLCDLSEQDAGWCGMKVREVINLLKVDGWVLRRTRGDHRQFAHPTKPGLVTVSGNLGRDVPPGTLASILRQARLRRNGS